MVAYVKIMVLTTCLILNIQGGEKMDTKLYNVSVIDLIANSKKYHNKHVVLIGFVTLKFENHALYLSSLDFKHSINKNALWISLEKNTLEKYNMDIQQYCIIEGVFNAHKKGHLGMYSGSIEKINRLDAWK